MGSCLSNKAMLTSGASQISGLPDQPKIPLQDHLSVSCRSEGSQVSTLHALRCGQSPVFERDTSSEGDEMNTSSHKSRQRWRCGAELGASRNRLCWTFCSARPGAELGFGTCLLLSEDVGKTMGPGGGRGGPSVR